MEALGADRVREVDRVLRAADVEQRVRRLVGGDVVDRREVEEVVDALELLARRVVDAELRLREVTELGLEALGPSALVLQRL